MSCRKLASLLLKTGIAITNNHVRTMGRYTVVEIEDSRGHKAIGIARCSDLDEFKAEVGLFIARGRAERALLHKLNHEKISHPLLG